MNEIQVSKQSEDAAHGSRRGFFTKSVAGGVGALAGVYVATMPKSSVQAQRASGSGFQSPDRFRSIRDHERAHVDEIIRVIQAFGGTPRPEPTFKNLLQATYNDFVATARILENVGVGAYLGAVPTISEPAVLVGAGQILAIEARHAGYLNVLANYPITDGVRDSSGNLNPNARDNQSFESPLTDSEVATLASPFIASLNGGPPVAYDSKKNAATDLQILNFALALEYLEERFYELNVARFFGG